ncbi:hypothetical protein U9M48_003345 [Paspalum notatum var. saurae]|uniref:Uncharacterized protein n=1 Tax=Paspalum notatum var. saurae TaxID=547442 RepID=A0AAQ3PMR1_PASNO
MVIPSLNRPRQGRPTPGQAARPPKSATCHIIDPHHEENTSALKSNRKTKHPMFPKAENAPSHGSTTSSTRGKSKMANARLTRGLLTSYKVSRPTLGGIFHVQQPS